MSIITLSFSVDNIEDTYTIFDKIQVWRSTSEPGSYSEITDDSPTAATLDGSMAGPWNLVGEQLVITLNLADPISIIFTGTNPLTLQNVLDQINTAFPDLASEVPEDTGKVRLKSGVEGTQSMIEVSGPAAAILGLSTSKINGKGARLLLSPTTETYKFRDYDGLSSYWYKTRYYNSETGAVSSFSSPIPASGGSGLQNLSVVGSIALVDMTGAPISGVRIIFVPILSQQVEDAEGNVFGLMHSVNRKEVITDSSGRASINLIPGQVLKVFIEGTTFHRQFQVPEEDFNVLTTAVQEPDPFSVATAPPLAIKVS